MSLETDRQRYFSTDILKQITNVFAVDGRTDTYTDQHDRE